MSRRPRSGTAAGIVGIRATAEERERWEAAALWSGKSLSDWIRDLCNEPAVRVVQRAWDSAVKQADAVVRANRKRRRRKAAKR